MNKKNLTLVATIITVILLAACAFLYLGEDRTGPVIEFESGKISYRDGGEVSALLEGVSAIDARDGDVSDTLKVDQVTEMQSGVYVVVTYVARDTSNNISKEERWVNLTDGSTSSEPMVDVVSEEEEPEEDETESESETQAVFSQNSQPVGNTVGKSDYSVPDDDESETEEESDTDAESETDAAVSEGAPVIALTTNTLNLNVGDTFYYLEYVKSCTDDKDSTEVLYSRIVCNGEDGDGNTVGLGTISTSSPNIYTLRYYVTDTDGNTSNIEKLEVIVSNN